MKDHLSTELFQPLPGLPLIIKESLKHILLEVLIIYSEKKDKTSLLLSDFAIDESNLFGVDKSAQKKPGIPNKRPFCENVGELILRSHKFHNYPWVLVNSFEQPI